MQLTKHTHSAHNKRENIKLQALSFDGAYPCLKMSLFLINSDHHHSPPLPGDWCTLHVLFMGKKSQRQGLIVKLSHLIFSSFILCIDFSPKLRASHSPIHWHSKVYISVKHPTTQHGFQYYIMFRRIMSRSFKCRGLSEKSRVSLERMENIKFKQFVLLQYVSIQQSWNRKGSVDQSDHFGWILRQVILTLLY